MRRQNQAETLPTNGYLKQVRNHGRPTEAPNNKGDKQYESGKDRCIGRDHSEPLQ